MTQKMIFVNFVQTCIEQDKKEGKEKEKERVEMNLQFHFRFCLLTNKICV